ncbi:MAG: methyltransferase domain-containing protein [Anaerolineales bacterium]|nr:methyltransferase domain-containing protein [Anaerolineales bacterium]
MHENPWEQVYRQDGHVFTDLPPIVPDFVRLLKAKELAAGRPLRNLLDVGCGNGRLLVHFARLGYRITGFDSAPTAIRLSKEWLDEEQLAGCLLLGDARQPLPFADQSFDILLSTQVIHHARLAAVLGTIAEIHRLVRPGGLILLTVPVYRMRQGEEKYATSDEIEYHTFVPHTGKEAGLPHHLFTLEEFGDCFPGFEALLLEVRDEKIIVLAGQRH